MKRLFSHLLHTLYHRKKKILTGNVQSAHVLLWIFFYFYNSSAIALDLSGFSQSAAALRSCHLCQKSLDQSRGYRAAYICLWI